jgi:hypothetical protein
MSHVELQNRASAAEEGDLVASTRFNRFGRHVERYARRCEVSFGEMANCRIEFALSGV